jgi:aldehyde:ferredoxin oxidoreductase
MNIKEMLSKHILLAEYKYQVTPLDKGYTDKVLHLNLTDNIFTIKDVPLQVKEKFIGGKGYGLKLLWDATNPDTKWNDAENEIVISAGPIAGITQYSGTGKSLVVTISPASNSVTDSNAGGYFGPFIKFSGFDAIEIQGKAKNDIIIIIDGTEGTVRIEEAPEEPLDSHLLSEILTEMYADNEESKHNVSVVSTGMAAEHSWLGMLNFSFWDKKKGAHTFETSWQGRNRGSFAEQEGKGAGLQDPGC